MKTDKIELSCEDFYSPVKVVKLTPKKQPNYFSYLIGIIIIIVFILAFGIGFYFYNQPDLQYHWTFAKNSTLDLIGKQNFAIDNCSNWKFTLDRKLRPSDSAIRFDDTGSCLIHMTIVDLTRHDEFTVILWARSNPSFLSKFEPLLSDVSSSTSTAANVSAATDQQWKHYSMVFSQQQDEYRIIMYVNGNRFGWAPSTYVSKQIDMRTGELDDIKVYEIVFTTEMIRQDYKTFS